LKIQNLTEFSKIYTSNVHLVLGTWNTIDDVNTLVDVGRDPLLIEKIKEAPTAIGKERVKQVVLTHSHYDHASLLTVIREVFKPVVYAFSPFLEGVDHTLKDGDTLKMGDRMFEVLHTPGHSNDSICLYCEQDGVLFAGDTHVVNLVENGSCENGFVQALYRLSLRDIRAIYFGHGPPLLDRCNDKIRASLKNCVLPGG